MSIDKMRTIVLYSLNPWNHVLPILRVIGPAQKAGFKVIPGNRMEIVSPRLASAADLIVVQRDFPRLTKPYLEILDRAAAARIPIVFELDDLLLELPGDHFDSQNQYYANAFLPMMQALMDANWVSVSTENLAEYLKTFNPAVTLLPNFLNDQIWRLRPPKPVKDQNNPVVIGYMASNTHAHDLDLISPALLEILDQYKQQVTLRVWGLKPPEAMIQQPNAQWIPLNQCDYSSYASYLADQECDIALAPLVDQPFNRSKSSLKFLEYSALGLAGVYSKLPAFETIVKHGDNGFLASTLEDWQRYICELIEDASLRHALAVNAQQTLQDGWLLSQNTDFLHNYYESILSMTPVRQNTSYPAQTLEQTWINIRMTLTPPGSLRERIAWLPVRTVQIIDNEGFEGVARRFRESTGRPRGASVSPMLFQRESSTGDRRTHLAVLPSEGRNIPYHAMATAEQISLNKASIVVLAYNNMNYTRLCLNSIFTHTDGMDYEVIVIDNASNDGTPAMLCDLSCKHSNLRVILNDANLGFAHGNNQGAAAATGDILIFLNNDTVVTPGWLTGLTKYLRNPQIGMVGPVTNSSGNESCIDFNYHNLNEMCSFAQEYTRAHASQAFEIGMLAFLCVGLRRSVFQEIGTLDEQFGLGMFEDDDYAIRLHQKDYRIICAQDVFIHHWGSASFSRLPSKKFFHIFNQNYKKFEKKWGKKGLAHV